MQRVNRKALEEDSKDGTRIKRAELHGKYRGLEFASLG